MSNISIPLNISTLNNLEDELENNPGQLSYWYNQLNEYNFEELEGRGELLAVIRATRLVMQYEHTNAEELKELAEREAVEMAEREENWEIEREMLKKEISSLRERITSRAGVDDANEAFRAEIDSLTAENAHLKQVGRERDREMADQRDRVEELSSRLQATEKERSVLVENQSQLEDRIRELNRRISAKSGTPLRNDWESRKLRQRSEQALLLSNQLQSVAAENDQLKTEVERLTTALESATAVIQESAERYAAYGEQLAAAERSIERFAADNRELKRQLSGGEAAASRTSDELALTNRDFAELVAAKDAQIEQLREHHQRQEMEIEELRARLSFLPDEAEREAELERLRQELADAIETMRRMFGEVIDGDGSVAEPTVDGTKALDAAAEPTAKLRLHIVHLDRRLDALEAELRAARALNADADAQLEQKDLANARLAAENRRLREMTFGDAESEIRRVETQLAFRDEQIVKLNRRCTLLQIELQQHIEATNADAVAPIATAAGVMEKRPRMRPKVSRHVSFGEETIEEALAEKAVSDAEGKRDDTDKPVEVATCENEDADYAKAGEEDGVGSVREADEATAADRKRQQPGDDDRSVRHCFEERAESSAALISSLYQEVLRLDQESKKRAHEAEDERRLHADRQRLLAGARQDADRARRELDEFKAAVLGERVPAALEGGDCDSMGVRCAELELENMELRRFVENRQTVGTESERRAAEASRRLVYLAIQNTRLERRAETSERLRRAAAQELQRVSARLQRLDAGDASRVRQLTLEIETYAIEIARLQNALLHAVPLSEYRRLQRDYKALVVASRPPDDGGYHSAAEDATSVPDDLDTVDISKSAIFLSGSDGAKADALLARNTRLQQTNDVLYAQNEHFKRELQKRAVEVAELEAFLADIENETEIKRMIANIERRFLQAIRDQFDSVQEQLSTEHEVNALRRQSHEARQRWRAERHHLATTVLRMQNVIRHLDAQRLNTPFTVEQLAALKWSAATLRAKESAADERLAELDRRADELRAQSAAAEAARRTTDAMAAHDYQLEHLSAHLHGYQLNVLTLTEELRKRREELEQVCRERDSATERCRQLEGQLNDFNFCQTNVVELISTLQRTSVGVTPAAQLSPEFVDRPPSHCHVESSESEDASPAIQLLEGGAGTAAIPPQIVIDLNATEAYEQRLRAVRASARRCVKNYQDQLEQKERAIAEYRHLIDGLQTELAQALQQQQRKQAEIAQPSTSDGGFGAQPPRPKTSAELIGQLEALEQRDRQILLLQHRVEQLEAMNARLTADLTASTNAVVAEKHSTLAVADTNTTMNRHHSAGKRKEKKKQRRSLSATTVTVAMRNENDNQSVSLTKPPKNPGNDRRQEMVMGPDDVDESGEKETPAGNNGNSKGSDASSEEPDSSALSSADRSSSSDSGSGSSASDSGTVEDIEGNSGSRRRSTTSRSRSVSNGAGNSSGGIVVRSVATSSGERLPGVVRRSAIHQQDDVETLVLRHRNDVRRLRTQVLALERRNKLSDENASLRERSRFAARRATDPAHEVNVARKENETLRRENRNLATSLQAQKDELSAARQRITKLEGAIAAKASPEAWAERKRHAQQMDALRQRVAEADTARQALDERLARRERHIEQLTREQTRTMADADRLQRVLREWREEKTAWTQRSAVFEAEVCRCVEQRDTATALADAAVKKNRTLEGRITTMHEEIQQLKAVYQQQQQKQAQSNAQQQTKRQPIVVTREFGVQTQLVVTALVCPNTGSKPAQIDAAKSAHRQSVDMGARSNVTSTIQQVARHLSGAERRDGPSPTTRRPPTVEKNGSSATSSDDGDEWQRIHALTKQLRRAELLQLETTEQLESIRSAYEELLKSYRTLLRIDVDRRRNRDELAAVAVLRDKLVGKDREIDQQRQRIAELEKKLWRLEIGG